MYNNLVGMHASCHYIMWPMFMCHFVICIWHFMSSRYQITEHIKLSNNTGGFHSNFMFNDK